MKKRYLYLNPVTYNQLIANNIDPKEYFKKLGFNVLDIPTHIFKKIKLEYRKLIDNSNDIVLDSRCPELENILRKERPEYVKYLAPIDSIFIRTAQYFYDSLVKDNPSAELLMISPCTQLCSCIDLDRVVFMTWRKFVSESELDISIKPAADTPLPMGYFSELGVSTLWLSGSDLSSIYSEIEEPKGLRLIEYLYCNGCHKGDGL